MKRPHASVFSAPNPLAARHVSVHTRVTVDRFLLGRVAVVSENNMRTDRVGERSNRPRGDAGLRIGMNAYVREAPAEARFHEPADRGIKGLSGRAKYFVHDGGRPSAERERPASFHLKRLFFLLAGGAFTTERQR